MYFYLLCHKHAARWQGTGPWESAVHLAGPQAALQRKIRTRLPCSQRVKKAGHEMNRAGELNACLI